MVADFSWVDDWLNLKGYEVDHDMPEQYKHLVSDKVCVNSLLNATIEYFVNRVSAGQEKYSGWKLFHENEYQKIYQKKFQGVPVGVASTSLSVNASMETFIDFAGAEKFYEECSRWDATFAKGEQVDSHGDPSNPDEYLQIIRYNYFASILNKRYLLYVLVPWRSADGKICIFQGISIKSKSNPSLSAKVVDGFTKSRLVWPCCDIGTINGDGNITLDHVVACQLQGGVSSTIQNIFFSNAIAKQQILETKRIKDFMEGNTTDLDKKIKN